MGRREPGAPYRHFAGKDSLLAAVVTESWERIGGQVHALRTAPACRPPGSCAALSASSSAWAGISRTCTSCCSGGADTVLETAVMGSIAFGVSCADRRATRRQPSARPDASRMSSWPSSPPSWGAERAALRRPAAEQRPRHRGHGAQRQPGSRQMAHHCGRTRRYPRPFGRRCGPGRAPAAGR
ncbi:hypothetical protein NKH18_22250 [Streptomyces sp. M10(2022)]